MKKAVIAVAATLAVVVVAGVVVPFLIPAGTWKSQIEERVSAATGRELTIAGPVHLSLLPAVAFVANDVTLANAPGARDRDMVSVGKLEVRVRLLPLLSGKLAIARFVADKPVIHLEVNRQGQPNWQFGPAQAQQPAAGQTTAPAQQSRGGPNVALGDIRISDGTLTYADARSDTRYEASAINARLAFPDLDHPFKFDGSLVWNKQKVSLTAEITDPRALSTGGRSNVGVAIHSDPMTAELKGAATGLSPLKFDGTLALSSPSVRNLAAWAGKPLAVSGNGLGPLSISGRLAADGAKVSFADATYKLDALEAHGNLSVDATGRIPYVKATLATNVLDLNPYLAQPQKGPGAPAAGKTAPPQTPAAAAAQGWSAEPIDVSGLKAVNADLALTAEGLVVHDIKLGKSALNVALKDGKMTSDLKEVALYQGAGGGRLTIDGAGRVPAMALDLHLKGIQAQPFLKDTAGFDAVRGTGNADVTLSASGASQRDLVSALNGKGAIKLQNGAIRGLDIAAMISNIGSAFADASSGKAEQTGFSDASATFTIANGVARNDDMSLEAPLFRAGGKGTVDMPKRTINYRIEPKLVPDPRGQGGWKNAIGIGVPIVITGPWDKIKYQPDLAGLLPDAQSTLRGLRDIFRGSNSGSGGSGSTRGDSSTPPSNPLDQLKNLFGR